MDPERAQFLIMIGEIGRQAHLAGLPVEVVTRDERTLRGVLDPCEAVDHELDSTGLAPQLTVGDATVALDDVVEVRVASP